MVGHYKSDETFPIYALNKYQGHLDTMQGYVGDFRSFVMHLPSTHLYI